MRVIDANFLFDLLHDRMKGAEAWITLAETDEMRSRAEGFLSALIEVKMSVEDEVTIIEVGPVRHGRWKHERLPSTSGGSYAVVRCSVCEYQYPMNETNFCPNCGARMGGEA